MPNKPPPSVRDALRGIVRRAVEVVAGPERQAGAPFDLPRTPSQMPGLAKGVPASSVVSSFEGPRELSQCPFQRGQVLRHDDGRAVVVDGLLWKSSSPWAMVLGLDAYERKRTIDWIRIDNFEGWHILGVADLALDPKLRHHLPHRMQAVTTAVVGDRS